MRTVASALLLLAPVLVPSSGDREDALRALESLGRRHAEMTVLRAQFVQTRRTALLETPLVSSGTFLFRQSPGCVVFTCREPREARIRLDERSYQVHHPQQGRAERFEFESNDLARAFLRSFSARPESLVSAFRIESYRLQDGVGLVDLTPIDEKTHSFLRRLVLGVRMEDGALVRLAYVDGQGDDVLIEFSKLEPNPVIDALLFDSGLPKGTQLVVHSVPPTKAGTRDR